MRVLLLSLALFALAALPTTAAAQQGTPGAIPNRIPGKFQAIVSGPDSRGSAPAVMSAVRIPLALPSRYVV